MTSFVIPAHNEARLIGGTIEALHASARVRGDPYEIIVVDDDSTDGTTEAATRAGARVVHVKARQIAVARNAGATAARGDVLVFVDADTLVPAATLSAAIVAARSGAVGGGARGRFDGRVPLYGHVALWGWFVIQRVFGVASGCFLFARRDDFEAVGGFDRSLFVGEDVDLSWRLKRRGRFVIVRDPVVTSGRMVRAYTAREVAGLIAGMLRHGPSFRRRRVGHWYRERREDPRAIDTGRPG